MTTVRLTMDVPADKLAALQAFLLGDAPEPEVIETKREEAPQPEPVKADPEPAKTETAPEPQAEEGPAVTKEDLRKLGVKLTKAERHDELLALFQKFGAENLKTLDKKHYAAFKKELEAII